MAVAVDQQHHGFSKSFARPPPPRPPCEFQSYSHHDYYYIMPEFPTQTSFAHPYFEQVANLNTHRRSFSSSCLPFLTTTTLDLDEEEKEEEEEGFNAAAANSPRIEMIGGQSDPRACDLVVEAAMAMASGGVVHQVPVSSGGGLGGTYFLHDQRNAHNDAKYSSTIVAVIKPIDEEPLAFDSPKGGFAVGQLGSKRSVRVGETGVRELAAYLLDHSGFAGVPPTALVKVSHVAFHDHHHLNITNDTTNNNSEANISPAPPPPRPSVRSPYYKTASLQRFVGHVSDAGDLGPSGFSVSSIHCIGILDVRLLNLDRHAGNMLVIKQGQRDDGTQSYNSPEGVAELVPIDHGLCLPEWLDDPYFEWLHWPQATVPFSDSEVEYILNLNPFKDALLLRKEFPENGIRESSIRVLVLCTIFLKQAVAAGLCLADIGEMMTREFHGGSEENSSVLENICSKAKKAVVRGSGDRIGSGYPQCEEETGGDHVSFGEISEEEWGLFLENFEKLLQEVLDGRRNMNSMKQQQQQWQQSSSEQ